MRADEDDIRGGCYWVCVPHIIIIIIMKFVVITINAIEDEDDIRGVDHDIVQHCYNRLERGTSLFFSLLFGFVTNE